MDGSDTDSFAKYTIYLPNRKRKEMKDIIALCNRDKEDYGIEND